MSFFKTDLVSASKQEGGNFINTSGIYDVIIKAIIVDTNDKGARSLNFYVDNNGTEQVIYGGIRLDNNDGSANFQANTFNKLCVIAGLDSVENPVEATLPIGPKGAAKDVAVLPDFEEFECKMRVQMEYSVPTQGANAGKIRESKNIKAFYRTDGASSDEIINETEVGVKLAKDTVYADNITYKESSKGAGDAPTPEEVTAWIAAGRGASATPAAAAATPKASFGKRTFGAK